MIKGLVLRHFTIHTHYITDGSRQICALNRCMYLIGRVVFVSHVDKLERRYRRALKPIIELGDVKYSCIKQTPN